MTRMPDAVEVDVGAGSGVEGARRATGGPDPAPTLPGRAPMNSTPRAARWGVAPIQSVDLTRYRRSRLTDIPSELVQVRYRCSHVLLDPKSHTGGADRRHSRLGRGAGVMPGAGSRTSTTARSRRKRRCRKFRSRIVAHGDLRWFYRAERQWTEVCRVGPLVERRVRRR